MHTISEETVNAIRAQIVEARVREALRPSPRAPRPTHHSPLTTPHFPEQPWQEWREKAGRWIPGDYLRPGYATDPPQFDPRPGETLSTPAFPAEEFRGELGGEPIDVVIPLGRGSPHGDDELRYCLRSIERFLDGLGRVWIVGEKPDWLIADSCQQSAVSSQPPDLVHLPVGDMCPIKDVAIIHKLLAACIETAGRPRLSERFAFVSDDQVLLRPVGWAQLGPYHKGDLTARTGWSTAWWQRMRHTRDWLRARGRPTLHGDTHAPLPMLRDELLRICRETAWRRPPGLCVGTLYLNWTLSFPRPTPHSLLPTPHAPRPLGNRYAWLGEALPAAEIRRRVAGRWFLGFGDRGFTSELRALLEELLPEKCRWEK